jgi:hypothetical protein
MRDSAAQHSNCAFGDIQSVIFPLLQGPFGPMLRQIDTVFNFSTGHA